MSGQLHPPGTPPGVPPLPPLLTPVQIAVLLDQVIYDQVVTCIDLDELYRVAQSLHVMIGALDGVSGARAAELARAVFDRALDRLPDDLRGYLQMTEWAERESCVLCQAEARQARHRSCAVTATGGDRRSKPANG